jgi:hypothetical protein
VLGIFSVGASVAREEKAILTLDFISVFGSFLVRGRDGLSINSAEGGSEGEGHVASVAWGTRGARGLG